MIRSHDIYTTANTQDNTQMRAIRYLVGTQGFARLGEDERKFLSQMHWVIRTVPKGTTLIDQGQDRSVVSVLFSGWAFRYQTLLDGKRQILDFLIPGALVGFGPGETNWYGVETVTDCTVASLSLTCFYRLLSGCPALAIRIAECVAMGEMRAHEHMTNLGRRNARERVAALIIELTSSTQLKKADSTTNAMELPITQVMIGDALGLSNEHVCRTLAKLAEDGVLELSHRALRVLDAEALAEEAGGDADMVPSMTKHLALAA
jgi:CRP/FNR family transcriptional regulator, anaerobic regulatory protein